MRGIDLLMLDTVRDEVRSHLTLAVLLTVGTGIDYLAQAYRLRSNSERTRLRDAERDLAA